MPVLSYVFTLRSSITKGTDMDTVIHSLYYATESGVSTLKSVVNI